jgi:hypothetical protein
MGIISTILVIISIEYNRLYRLYVCVYLDFYFNIPFFIEINAVFLRVNFRSRRSQKPYSPNPVKRTVTVLTSSCTLFCEHVFDVLQAT